MSKEKVTLTLDSATLGELRSITGSRSLSASVDAAIRAYAQRKRHLAAVDEWLAALDQEYGPVPTETLEWAARIVDRWQATRDPRRVRRAG